MKKIFLSVFVIAAVFKAGAQPDTVSLTLEQACAFALENNYQVKSSRLDIQISKKDIRETTAMGLPQINGNINYQYFIDRPVSLVPAEFFGGRPGEFAEIQFGTEQNASAEIKGTQLIFDGSYFVGLQASKTYADMAQKGLEKSETEVKNAVSKAYYNALVAEENIKILAFSQQNLEKTLKEAKLLLTAGFTEQLDVDQVNLLVTRNSNRLKNAQRQKQITHNLLKFQMGMSRETVIVLDEQIKELINEQEFSSLVENEFDVSSHIDYQLINSRERLMFLNSKNEKSKFLPSVSGFISYQQNAFRDGFDFFESGSKWFPTTVWGINLRVPIFSSSMRLSRLQKANLELEKVKLKKEETEARILLNIESAKLEYANALDNYATEKKNLELTKRIREKTAVKYTEGMATSFELTQVENQFLSTQGNFIHAILQLLSAKSNLKKALNSY